MSNEDMQQHGTGSLPSPEDYRDIKVEHLAGAAPSAFPASFHIDFSGVKDLYQRKIGACTAHASAELAIHRQQRLTGRTVAYSPRFVYALAKIEDGLDASEQATYCNMPLKIGVKYGFATEATTPNDTTLAFNDYIYGRAIGNIPAAAFDEADQNRIPGYARVGAYNAISEAQLKQAIQTSLDGVKMCLKVGREWYTAADGRVSWAAADILPIRKCVAPESGHDIVATGWETEAGTGRCKVFFRNHWSLAWGDQDNGWFYLDEHTLSEAWVISEIPDALLAIIRSLPSQKTFSHTWNADLAIGSRGADVEALQIALKIVGTFPLGQAVTQYYGPFTAAAVQKFQAQYNVASPADIATAAGKLGPRTRAALNKIFTR